MAHPIGCCLLLFNWVCLDILYLFLCNRTHLPSCFYSIQVVVWVGPTTNPELGQTESFVHLNNWFPQIEGCLGTIVVVILRRRCYGMLLSQWENNKWMWNFRNNNKNPEGKISNTMNVILGGHFCTWWPLNTFTESGSSMEKRFGMLQGDFLPYLSMELTLRTSSSLVLRIGMVFSGHLPFWCHVWVKGFGAIFELLLSPSGWQEGIIWKVTIEHHLSHFMIR